MALQRRTVRRERIRQAHRELVAQLVGGEQGFAFALDLHLGVGVADGNLHVGGGERQARACPRGHTRPGGRVRTKTADAGGMDEHSRSVAWGGNPLTGEGKQDERFFDGARLSASLKGEISAFNRDVGVTYMRNTREIVTPDIIVTRLQAALNGLGGPNCATATPGANGCLWLNPFSTAVQGNSATGVAFEGTRIQSQRYSPSATISISIVSPSV